MPFSMKNRQKICRKKPENQGGIGCRMKEHDSVVCWTDAIGEISKEPEEENDLSENPGRLARIL